ncbi:MAG: glycosyltransferase family 4 protein, partial [Clostridiales bacterium]|nr:glycosyltransferase family 4 protein [Clostridiales bacterium]
QFHKPLVKVLHEHGIEVHVAAKDNLAEKNGLRLDFAEKVFDVPFSRSPKSPSNLKALKMLKKIIAEGQYDLIQCNTPMGGIITRLAAKKARKKGTKVVYMAHGFHFYKGGSKKAWMFFYPIEKHFAKKCDTLITITKEDYALASKKFKTNVVHMHGVGVSEERYHVVDDEATQQVMREKENIRQDEFVILCTGELNKNKNQTTLLRAAAQVKEQIPTLKVLLAGNGPLREELETKVKEYGLEQTVRFLGYRTDLENVVPIADLIVSCSKREGLPLNIIEAMLCKKPIVASINRGHSELIRDGESGYLFQAGDWETLATRILDVYQTTDYTSMGEAGYQIAQAYTARAIEKEIEEIYIKQ